MLIIPAIDIRNGKCVRLTRGDFGSEKIYSDDPVRIAKEWEKAGAEMLHIVDLDGAKNGDLSNLIIIKKIVNTVTIPLQVGGGIRNKESIERLLSIGVWRVILGTLAVEDKTELKKILSYFPTQIAIALDSKNGKLMKQGWLEDSNKNNIKAAIKFQELRVQRFIYTDITRDGTLTEPNYKEIKKLLKSISVPLVIGGGISSLEQIKRLESLGVEAVIIGKALYEGKINLKEALYAC